MTRAFLSKLSVAGLRTWKRQLRDGWRGETAEHYFDLENRHEVNAALTAHGVSPLAVNAADAEESVIGAARFILANLVCNRAVRRHYPQALLSTSESTFAAFLCDGLSERAQANVRAAFAQPPGEPVKRVLEVREDLRLLFPLALTPHQRRPFLAWLLAHGQRELGVTPEAALWCLIEMDETSDRGLIPSYLFNERWQGRLPYGITAFGWAGFREFVQKKYAIEGRWLKRAQWRPVMRPHEELRILQQTWHQLFRDRPRKTDDIVHWLGRMFGFRDLPQQWIDELKSDIAGGLLDKPGVNVIGHYRYASGLQEACSGAVKALADTLLATRDLPVHFPADWRDRERHQSLEVYDTTLYVAAVNTFPKEYFRRSGLRMRAGVKRIAYWYWEVDKLPEEWRPELAWADEVWAPTAFLAEAYRKYVNVPVVPMLPGIQLAKFDRLPREYFKLPNDRFLVLFSFDMGSVMERKNPLGLIEAFRNAFRRDDRVHLAIKVSRGEFHPQNLAQLKTVCQSVNATLIDRVLTREEMLALLATADCYASLHRAEGLGLGLAESMLLGTPTVGTAWSGNVDFMTVANSFPVRASLKEIVNVPPYPDGSTWAEPDLDHAAEQLRFIYDHREEAFAIAKRGQQELTELFSIKSAGKRMTARLGASR